MVAFRKGASMKSKTYIMISVIGMLALVLGFVGLTVYVDPLFHYHAPVEELEYPLFDERYMNDGIIRHFDYDAVITGTSMTQNFKTSTLDSLFGTNAIKVPMSGATYREINELLEDAFRYNDNIEMVVRGLDLTMLFTDKDSMSYDEYPEYLYDDNIFNDVYYVLNKDIFVTYTDYVFEFMESGGKSSTFDAYKNWHGQYEYNANALRKGYQRKELSEEQYVLTEEEEAKLRGNMEQNVIELIKAHPETEFYLFIPPYSILYWDDLQRMGTYQKTLEAHRIQVEMLLPYENVHLYSFFDDYLMICDLSYYIDSLHYNQFYSEKILQNMKDGIGLLSKENYEEYFKMLIFYDLFDYEAFFASE